MTKNSLEFNFTDEFQSQILKMETEDEEAVIVAKNFIKMVDNLQQWSSNDLADDAILDWFGRSVCGRESIINFMKVHIPKMRHTIETIARIPPINHRSIKRLECSTARTSPVLMERFDEECGQGDCWGKSTPENRIRPNFKELVKAPRKKRTFYLHSSQDLKKWKYLEIKGKLEYEEKLHDGTIYTSDKKIQRIILAYTSQIHLVVYEGRNLCKKKLSNLFSIKDE